MSHKMITKLLAGKIFSLDTFLNRAACSLAVQNYQSQLAETAKTPHDYLSIKK